MKCTERTLEGAVLVSASGRIDLAAADAFREALLKSQAQSPGALIVDLSAVDYISSAGLRSLMIVFKTGKSAGKPFAIACPSPLVQEILTISRMHLVFPIFEDQREAIGNLAPAALAGFDAL